MIFFFVVKILLLYFDFDLYWKDLLWIYIMMGRCWFGEFMFCYKIILIKIDNFLKLCFGFYYFFLNMKYK